MSQLSLEHSHVGCLSRELWLASWYCTIRNKINKLTCHVYHVICMWHVTNYCNVTDVKKSFLDPKSDLFFKCFLLIGYIKAHGDMLNVMSCALCHMSCVTCHTSCVTSQMSHFLLEHSHVGYQSRELWLVSGDCAVRIFIGLIQFKK